MVKLARMKNSDTVLNKMLANKKQTVNRLTKKFNVNF